MFDGERFGAEMVVIVRDFVERELAPLRAQNASLAADNADLVKSYAALMADNAALAARISAIESLPVPEKGEKGDAGTVDMDVLVGMVASAVQDAVAALPAPEKGKDGFDGLDGKDADPEVIRAMVAEAIAGLAAPEKGEKGDAGADGAGLADALIDRDGQLVLTLTDGRVRTLGRVVGKDGERGKDGTPIGLEDINMELMEDDRTLRIGVSKGEMEYAFQIPFPVVLDRGVWREDRAYDEGDGVTWGGSWWIAQRENPGKPDTADSGWRLAVKKGRDGKDAR